MTTPKEAGEGRARELLEIIVANAVVQPDARMNGSADCYGVPLDDIDAARKLLAEPRDTGRAEWRPIESAPKGRKIIAGYVNPLGKWRTIMAVYMPPMTLTNEDTESGFADEGWYEEGEAYAENMQPTYQIPTHWMPLPAPPSLPKIKGE